MEGEWAEEKRGLGGAGMGTIVVCRARPPTTTMADDLL